MGMCSCGSTEIVYNAGDGVDSWGRYRWNASYYCRKCEMSSEVDGGGTTGNIVIEGLPEEVKTFIIHKDGEWQLVLNTSKEVQMFFKSRILQNVEVDFENTIILSGTFMQMQWVKKQLIAKGLKEEKIKIVRKIDM